MEVQCTDRFSKDLIFPFTVETSSPALSAWPRRDLPLFARLAGMDYSQHIPLRVCSVETRPKNKMSECQRYSLNTFGSGCPCTNTYRRKPQSHSSVCTAGTQQQPCLQHVAMRRRSQARISREDVLQLSMLQLRGQYRQMREVAHRADALPIIQISSNRQK